MTFSPATVVPFRIVSRNAEGRRVRLDAGFRLQRFYQPGHDEMFETLEHPAIFRTAEAAERFAARVNAPGAGLRLKAWAYNGGLCSPLVPNEIPPYSVL